jgi:anti-anti-sigma factor
MRLGMEVGHIGTIHIRGDVDPTDVSQLDTIISMMLRDGTRQVVVDCHGLDFIDSAGLDVLANAHRRLSCQGGTLTIRHPSAITRRLLRVTRLDEVVSIETAALVSR